MTAKFNLTDRFCRTVAPSSARRLYWDALQSGLALSVEPSGHKAWKVAYRASGKLRWLTLGSIGALGLREARAAGRVAMARVALGGDPQAEKIAARHDAKRGDTLARVHARYLAEFAQRNNKSWHQSDYLLRSYVLPVLGARRAAEIERRDIRAIFDRLTAERGKPVMANQVLAAASAVFSWAVEHDLVRVNPAQGIARNATKPRERYLLAEELRCLWPALEARATAEAAALQIILLTGARPGEVAAARWENIANGSWELPGDPVPEAGWPGTKNGISHRLPITDAASTILDRLGRRDSGFVFVAPRGGHVSNLDILARNLAASLGLAPFTPHTLRATVASHLSGMGIAKDTISRILNHREGGITAGYIRHSFDREKQVALVRWADRLREIVAGEAARVINIAR